MTEKKKWRIGGPLTNLVPPGKEKGDALPPESMKLREQILAEDARRKAERQKEVPGAVSAGPPEKGLWGGKEEELFEGGGTINAWILTKEDLPWNTPPLKDLVLLGQEALGRIAAFSHLEDNVDDALEAASMLIRVAVEMEIHCVAKLPMKEKAG
jgi:hypothetical protein